MHGYENIDKCDNRHNMIVIDKLSYVIVVLDDIIIDYKATKIL